MHRHTFRQDLLISLCCSAVVALVLACNSTNTPRIASANSLASRLTLGTFSHLIPASKNAPLFAAMFQTAQSASDVPESFQFTCLFSSEQ